MSGDGGKSVEVIEGEVALADGIYAVGGNARKAEITSDGQAVDGKRTSCESTRTHGASGGGFQSVLNTQAIAVEGLRMRKKEVGKKQRLGECYWGHSRHGNVNAVFRLFEENPQEVEKSGADFAGGLRYEHAEFCAHEF